jgi:hypothetical protein
MSPASYQTAPPRGVFFRFCPLGPILDQTGGMCRPLLRAGNGTRTRDPNLGKVVLYQLSYSREAVRILAPGAPRRNDPTLGSSSAEGGHGGEGDRTPDLVNAIHALSQLSYAPAYIVPPSNGNRGKLGNVARACRGVNEGRTAALRPYASMRRMILQR